MDVIVERKPRSRGVTQLTYVGNDEHLPDPNARRWLDIAGGAAIAYAAIGAPKGQRGIWGAAGLVLLLARRIAA